MFELVLQAPEALVEQRLRQRLDVLLAGEQHQLVHRFPHRA